MNFESDVKLNVFTGPTTYLNDYRKYPGIYRINPDYSRAKYENPASKPPPPRLMDQETFIPLRKKIPMNLMIQPNEVTGMNPHREIGDTVRKKLYCITTSAQIMLWHDSLKNIHIQIIYKVKGECSVRR